MAFSTRTGPVGTSQPMAEINVIPLVDVMLVLLVIFIITAPLMTQALPVKLPRADGSPLEEPPHVVHLSLDEADQMYFNGEPVAYETMLERLSEAVLQPGQKPSAQIHAYRHAHYERVVLMMAAAQRAGITSIAFVTEGATAASPAESQVDAAR